MVAPLYSDLIKLGSTAVAVRYSLSDDGPAAVTEDDKAFPAASLFQRLRPAPPISIIEVIAKLGAPQMPTSSLLYTVRKY